MKSKSVQSTSTPDGSMLKLGNDLWCDVELIATKVSSQMCRKWKTISEDSVETDCTRLTFPRQSRGNQKIFKLFCLWKSSSTVLLANLPSFHREKFVLKRSQISVFRGKWLLKKNRAKNVWRENNFGLCLINNICTNICWSTFCSQELWGILSDLKNRLEQSENENLAHKKSLHYSCTVDFNLWVWWLSG